MIDRRKTGGHVSVAGTWLILLALLTNAVAVMLVPQASAGETSWIQICTVDGIRSVALEGDGPERSGDGIPSCPVCPLCPALSTVGLPVPAMDERLGLPLSPDLGCQWSSPSAGDFDASTEILSFLSRAPPVRV